MRFQDTRVKHFFIHLFMIVAGIFMLYPILWMFSSSLKPEQLIFTDMGLWPRAASLDNYIKGWHVVRGTTFGQFFANSFFISAFAVFGNLITCSMAAYVFARIHFPLRSFWFALMLSTIMLPSHVTLVPQYAIFHYMNWVNTFYPLTVPRLLATDAFFIFLLVQFFRGIPREIDESATIDGCGPIQIYYRMILPLSVPALITTAIFTFIWSWDDFFSHLLYLNTADKFIVPLGLRLFVDSEGESAWGSVFAMSVLSLLPVIIVFFIFQRYIVEGIATQGIKG